jgi:TDG/mug DNA glycosylase family protein
VVAVAARGITPDPKESVKTANASGGRSQSRQAPPHARPLFITKKRTGLSGLSGLPLRRLRDVALPRPRLLLVGINPGIRSAQVGHHFAGLGNPFWRLLHAAGLTPTLLPPEDDSRLAELGIALTNVCARPTRSAVELTARDLDRGWSTLVRKCTAMKPGAVGLVGLSLCTSYVRWLSRRQRDPIRPTPGPGAKPETIGGAPIFVVPNPSGLNASYPGFAEKLVWYQALATFVDSLAAAGSRDEGRDARER